MMKTSYFWRPKHRVGIYRALWLTPMLLASTVLANNAKISPDLQSLLSNPSSRVNVIAQYTSAFPCSTSGFAGSVTCPATTLLGGTVTQVLSLVNAVAGSMAASAVTALSNQPNVSYISLDRPLAGSP